MNAGKNRTSSFVQNKAIRYMDTSSLSRPLDMPPPQKKLMRVFIVIAVIIGMIMLFSILDTLYNAPTRNAASVENNINRNVSYKVPVLTTLTGQSGDVILNTFSVAGYSILQIPNTTQSATNIDIFKLPSDVSLVDAAADYSVGINNLSAAEAARLLTGSWRMTLDNSVGNHLRVRYADFASTSLDAAIQTARTEQGLAGSTVTDSGIDSAGNTFQSGYIDVGGLSYSWQVSACLLSEVYPVSGLPTTALYVGVRLYR